MNDGFVPKINCRFKIRKDLDGFLGFFQGKGVLTFNEVGAFIVKQMMGEKNLQEIGQSVKIAFPEVGEPLNEVLSIAGQLRNSGFLQVHNGQGKYNLGRFSFNLFWLII